MRYPLLLDELILRDFAMYLGMILVSFILLTLVFTFFELLGDIVRNRIPMIMVGQYLLNVTPSMIYLMAPLSVLLAVLTTIGLLQKTNEITAMKATGTSIYRVIFPIFVIAAALSTGLFFSTSIIFQPPISARRRSAIRSKANLRRPTFAPTASGSLASTTPFITMSFLIPTRTPSPISRPSSSILNPSS